MLCSPFVQSHFSIAGDKSDLSRLVFTALRGLCSFLREAKCDFRNFLRRRTIRRSGPAHDKIKRRKLNLGPQPLQLSTRRKVLQDCRRNDGNADAIKRHAHHCRQRSAGMDGRPQTFTGK
jgi:hypothetical protein